MSTRAPTKKSSSSWLLLVLLLGLGFGIILFLRSGRGSTAAAPPTASPGPTPASNTVPTLSAASPYARLVGRWLRPDGGYLMIIDKIEADGTAVAGYFNPKPIHVARARASREGALLRFFLELQDVNYPGSTYTLTFDPEANELRGEYFQAAMRQSFDVTFIRPP